MQHSAAGEDKSSDSQETPRIFGTEYSLPHSLQPAVLSQSSSCLLIHFNIILPSTLKSSKWSPSLRCPQQNPAWTPVSQRAIIHAYLITFDLLNPLIFVEEYTHTCPQRCLQMHSVMLQSVTIVQQVVYPQQEDCIISVYIQMYPLHLGKGEKMNLLLNSRLWNSRFMYNKKERSVILLLLLVPLILLLASPQPPAPPQPPPNQQKIKNFNNNQNKKINHYNNNYYYYCYYYYHHY